MSAFLAFLETRSFLVRHPAIPEADAIATLYRVHAGSSGLDFRGGLALLRALDSSLDWQLTRSHVRLFAFEWVKLTRPPWLRLIPHGRGKLRVALGDDQAQCLRQAGLFEEVPDKAVLAWWDRLANLVRSATETERMQRARHAERLSLEFELRRLSRLGIPRNPRWVALEDNSLGYDILSYDVDQRGLVVTRLIEVKSRLSDDIFITRNEWENAAGAEQQSVIHVWDLPEERLREFRVYDIAPHIPLDQGDGTWVDVRITLPSWTS